MLQLILCQYCARYKIFLHISIIYLYIKRLLYTKQAISLFQEKKKN